MSAQTSAFGCGNRDIVWSHRVFVWFHRVLVWSLCSITRTEVLFPCTIARRLLLSHRERCERNVRRVQLYSTNNIEFTTKKYIERHLCWSACFCENATSAHNMGLDDTSLTRACRPAVLDPNIKRAKRYCNYVTSIVSDGLRSHFSVWLISNGRVSSRNSWSASKSTCVNFIYFAH